jgi:hypothetical protein
MPSPKPSLVASACARRWDSLAQATAWRDLAEVIASRVLEPISASRTIGYRIRLPD